MPQHDLGSALSLDPSNVVGLLNELARTYSQLGTIEDELFSALSSEERVTLHELLARAVGGAAYTACAAAGPCEGTSACEVPGAGEPSC
jgi:hypothetical protein